MCRFVLYLGSPITLSSLVTEPANSLIHQSFHSHEREEPLNGDGFGVAWYSPESPEKPALFRSISPAWNNRNLLELARVTRSKCILAHVRAATQGTAVVETNCHPFTWGPYSFMHNGELGGFSRFRRRLLALLSDEAFAGVEGTTDSEHLFALLQDKLRASDPDLEPVEAMAEALNGTILQAVELSRRWGGDKSYLNLALSDGRQSVACRCTDDTPDRADSLYFNAGQRYVCREGVCRMVQPETGTCAALVSSEPLSEDPGWQPVPVNHVVLIPASREVETRSLPSLS